MKKIILKLLMLAPVFLVVMGVNLVVDPAHLINSDAYVAGFAKYLLAGKNVAGFSNYDERLLQKKYIQGLTRNKDIIVLGSSRTLLVSGDYFPGQSFFNNSVSGATIEDDIAIFQAYENKGFKPASVIICLDPWLLNRNNGQIRWKTLSAEYREGLNRLGITDSGETTPILDLTWPDKFSEMISPAYLKSSIQFVIKEKRLTDTYYVTPDQESSVKIKKPDGTLSYDAEFRLADVSKVHSRVLAAINSEVGYSLENFSQLDPQLRAQFEAFVKHLQSEGIKVTFLLSPYHPLMYNYLVSSEKYRIITDVQDYFMAFGREVGSTVRGSYNPQDIPCGENEFFDEMHARPTCMQKIFKQ